MAETECAPTDKELKEKSDTFSVFAPGHINQYGRVVMAVKPLTHTNIENVYQFITSERWAGNATEELRQIDDHAKNSEFKMLNFYVATFSGMYNYRKTDAVIAESGYMVLDYDEEDILKAYPNHAIEDAVCRLRKKLIADKNLVTVLLFISPNGNGLKQVIKIGDKQGLTHREAFDAIAEYIFQRYGVKVDASGSDICRACFLPYDPDCYLNPKYKEMETSSLNLKIWLAEKNKRNEKVGRQTMLPTAYMASGSFDSVFDLVENWVSKDTVYAKGTYNRYVCKCGYLLCEFGVPEVEAEQWAVSRFSDYRTSDIISIFRSCYRHGNFGKREFIKSNKHKI